jgi:arylsulfatase A
MQRMPISLTCALLASAAFSAAPAEKPNVVFILADDLGYAELGSYGQKKIRTPNLDRMASEGMRFTQFYSGAPVCAPSRCVLLTGKHTGHAAVRDNKEVGTWESHEGQHPLPADEITLAEVLKGAGYATACVGKWGLGNDRSSGAPARQGFDLFFGYNCQRHAHNYYPAYLLRNGERVELEGNTAGVTGKVYAPDLMIEEALSFIRKSSEKPFFLYFATTVPHLALQVPEDSLAEYADAFEETPYGGGEGYQPHPKPRAAYAAMISRMDRDVGRIAGLLEELGLDRKTIVIFSSDNGTTFLKPQVDYEFFRSVGPLRGLKGSLYEGGLRVPFIARWPGRVGAGAVSDFVCGMQDVLPTVAELAGLKAPPGIDGISLVPTLVGEGVQPGHSYLYWESFGAGAQAVRFGDWKAVRTGLKKNAKAPVELFNLREDIGETKDVANSHTGIVEKATKILQEARTPSNVDEWNFMR